MKTILFTIYLTLLSFLGFSQITTFQIDAEVDQNISCYGNHDGFIVARLHGVYPGLNVQFYLLNENDSILTNNAYGAFFNLPKGLYKVIAKNQFFQSNKVDSLIIKEPEKLNIEWTIVKHPYEYNDSDGILAIDITGGTANLQPYLVWWLDGFTGDTLNNLLINNFATVMFDLRYQTYQVVVEDDNGCTAVSEFYFDKP